jgi:hypothetical protein
MSCQVPAGLVDITLRSTLDNRAILASACSVVACTNNNKRHAVYSTRISSRIAGAFLVCRLACGCCEGDDGQCHHVPGWQCDQRHSRSRRCHRRRSGAHLRGARSRGSRAHAAQQPDDGARCWGESGDEAEFSTLAAGRLHRCAARTCHAPLCRDRSQIGRCCGR